MIEGLRRNGVEVVECHQQLWHGVKDRVRTASGGWLRPGFVVRFIRTYWGLLRAYRQVGHYDVMVLGYPGQVDVYLARVLTWLRRKPLVLDVFMSIYLIALERGLVDQHPVTARLIYWLEKLACSLPDCLIQDTAEYVHWFREVYALNPTRFRLVPTGADDRVFHPLEVDARNDDLFRVLYYGTFIPNHGIEYIVEAARILANEDAFRFELVGKGPDLDKAMRLVQRYDLSNVDFVGWLDKEELVKWVARADVCLGAFGITPQSVMTIQNKIYEGLAMAKPVITGDAPAVRAAMRHGEHVYLVERANPNAIAAGLLALKADSDLRRRLAQQGRRLFLRKYSMERLGQYMLSWLLELDTQPQSSPIGPKGTT
jgi:glycosyltransferase involved in cell wall biosynthesis